jgi:hypothetical protein
MTAIKSGTCRKIYCNTCKLETNHELKAISSRRCDETDHEGTPFEQLIFWEEYRYCFWVCRGCDTATFEEVYDCMGYGEHPPKSNLYPRREDKSRAPLKDYRILGSPLWPVYGEIIESFNAGLRIICSMGIRALLEGICVEKEGITDEDAFTLTGKLKILKERLEEREDLPHKVAETLDCLKSIGDDAAHGLEAPTRKELEQAIEFVESLIEFIYRIGYRKAVYRFAKGTEALVDGEPSGVFTRSKK